MFVNGPAGLGFCHSDDYFIKVLGFILNKLIINVLLLRNEEINQRHMGKRTGPSGNGPYLHIRPIGPYLHKGPTSWIFQVLPKQSPDTDFTTNLSESLLFLLSHWESRLRHKNTKKFTFWSWQATTKIKINHVKLLFAQNFYMNHHKRKATLNHISEST